MRGSLTLTIALALIAAAGAARAEDGGRPEDGTPSPFEVELAVDLPIILAATAIWTLPLLIEDELPGGHCQPCDPRDVGAFDREVIGLHSSTARLASDLGVAALPVLAAAQVVAHGLTRGPEAFVEDLIIIGETAAVAGAVNQVVRNAFARPRPWLYDEGYAAGRETSREDYRSFFSAHTTLAFATAVSASLVFTRRHPDSGWRWPIWALGLSAAAGVGVLRVAGGMHFPTDVIAGAVVGAATGIAVPVLHGSSPRQVVIRPAGAGISGTF